MVPLQAGRFVMGSPEAEAGRSDEGPQWMAQIAEPFAIGRFPVAVAQFASFVRESGHPVAPTCRQWDGGEFKEKPGSFLAPGFEQTADHPAVCVSWDDARAYAAWLSAASGQAYRLPSEAEWEYAARAGTTTRYWWGDEATAARANYKTGVADDAAAGGDRPRFTVPVGRFEPNPWGLYQMHGNVWEWVEDRWRPSYIAISGEADAAAAAEDRERRTLRGGSWLNSAKGIRSARRHAARPDFRRTDIGFRIAMTL